MPQSTFCVLLQITTRDPRLTEAKIVAALNGGSAGAFAAIRHAVLSRLPKDVERLVAIMPLEQAQDLMALHEQVQEIRGEQPPGRPPPDYVPPTND
jgi:hypothetical protein